MVEEVAVEPLDLFRGDGLAGHDDDARRFHLAPEPDRRIVGGEPAAVARRKAAEKARRLGAKYGDFKDDPSEFIVRVTRAYRDFNKERGAARDAVIPDAERAAIRTRIGRETFTELHGRAPIDSRELSGHIARMSRPPRKAVAGYDKARILLVPPPLIQGIGSAGGYRLMLEDREDRGYAELNKVAGELIGKANQSPSLAQVYTLFDVGTPRIFADVDRRKADLLGVGTNTLAMQEAPKVENAARGIAVANTQTDVNLSLFGHSYGSTTSGIAAQELAVLGRVEIEEADIVQVRGARLATDIVDGTATAALDWAPGRRD